MIMSTLAVETTATLRVHEAGHVEMEEVSLDINMEDGIDTDSDAEMKDSIDNNLDIEMEDNPGVPTKEDPRELAAATSGQSLCIAMLEMPGSQTTVLQVNARCTLQYTLEIEAYIMIEGHGKRTIGQASRLLARETDGESFFTATQDNSLGVTLLIPGYQDRVLWAEAHWNSRYGIKMMCGISNAAAYLKF
ncbi:hypothetical protein FGADI_2682 [Fusarium gaditjirri]|uniref:Uncharacterized protein n=1 Tax=Fusarium gaditjirri TaxID=282569 RepID=A0A8H4X151_9HYPO|nr:hypothetical protein FGADI_2682 [Fusarium gaditjirri]